MIVRKTVELQQLHGEFEQISAAVQEAKKKPAASSSSKASGGKGKVGGKKTVSKRKVVDSSASRGQETAAGGDEGEDNATTSAASSGFSGWLPTSIDSVRESVMGAAEYAFERRAYVLFPVVAAIFHFYGDYASV